jgi:hypothetical protein
MDYILVENGRVVGYPRQLPKTWNNISNFNEIESEKIFEYGWYPVRFIPNPNKNKNSITIGNDYVIESTEVLQYEKIRQKTQDEINQEYQQEWENIRQQRNQLLYECDWTQLQDAPLTPSKLAEWMMYRQQLRNITALYSNPYEVEWPPKPE